MKNKKEKQMIRAIEKWTGSSRHDELIFFIAILAVGLVCFVILVSYLIDKLFL